MKKQIENYAKISNSGLGEFCFTEPDRRVNNSGEKLFPDYACLSIEDPLTELITQA